MKGRTGLAPQGYLSIGDVLSLLREEFPDVTISKIRFLESQGLLDPERTPSGYRKFYDHDVERLRWILVQQRENFLPLKVIKDRLADVPAGAPPDLIPEAEEAEPVPVGATSHAASGASSAEFHSAMGEPLRSGGLHSMGITARQLPDGDGQPQLEQNASSEGDGQPGPSGAGELDAGESKEELNSLAPRPNMGMTLGELVATSGLSTEEVGELEAYGLVVGEKLASEVYYGPDALTVAKLAAGFRRYGIEARHLRQYKNAADREAGLFEQIIIPLIKRRNPDARRRSIEAMEELSRLGRDLRSTLVAEALRHHLQV